MAGPRVSVSLDHLSCGVCRQVLRDPATIPCGHSFCMVCIRRCWDRDKRDNCPRRCPKCHLTFPSAPLLIRNTALAELLRDTGGCERSGQREEAPEPPGAPRPSSARPAASPSAWCRRHSSPLDVYCCTDQSIVCAACASDEHRGHRIGFVGEERRRKQEELEIIQTSSKRILQQHERKLGNLRRELELIQEKANETVDHCERVLVGVITSLQRHHLSVRELITAQKEAGAARVQTSIQTLEAKIKKMKKRDAELDHLAQTVGDVRFLQAWPSVQDLCEDEHLQGLDDVSEDALRPFELTKRSVEQLLRQLEEYCSRGFASVSETVLLGGDGALTPRREEPTTRAEFLHYACELTLDPTTAHEDLVVSAGDKEVCLSPPISRVSAPTGRSPERFIHRRQLLCRQGLQAERCYYEIEVEGHKAEIALAYKGLDRRSRNKQSAFGGNANSWSLDRGKDYSVSHNNKSVRLIAAPCHMRIGVYLKFREGTLSFYEVSDDTMIFLYRAEANFTEPLYPGFWLGEGHIRICDLEQDGL